ncbi:MAG: ABC transporter permease [Myxococcales bacterium]|nr:ABC transporter permease [Myxococcales bacterium]
MPDTLPHQLARQHSVPLPSLWVHRTPRSTFYARLDADSPTDYSHRETLIETLRRGLRSALSGAADGQGAGWFHVLAVLVRTDFRARYRGQALGIVWSVLYPLVMMSIMSFIFTHVFQSTDRNFPIFLLIGLICWQWITNSTTAATSVIVSHADIIKRTIFPRHLLPMAIVFSYGINFCIEAMTLLLFIPIFPHAFTLSPALLLVPVFLFVLALLLTGIALITSGLNVIYRDVAYLVNTGLLILYWLTPVLYNDDRIPYPYRLVIQANPFSGLIVALRRAIMEGHVPSHLGWAGILLPTLVIFVVGWLVFRSYERMVLDYV